MKISSIYGKKVISTSGKEGYAVGVYEKDGRLECIVCADENEKEFTVGAEGIKSIGNKIVFREEGKFKKSGKPVKLGKPVFDCSGAYIGKLTDYTLENNRLVYAVVGNKKFSCDDIVAGDAVIIKSSARIIKSDVKTGGKILIRRGTPLTPEIERKAQSKGEYIQTNLKTI